ANTGAGGGYTFTGVADGSYTIQLYTYAEETSPQDQGSDDTLDSDLTALVTMSGEAAITHVDGGERYALSLSDPSDSDSADNVIAEDAADNTAVGITVVSADPPFTPLVYALTDDAGGRFQIDAASGVVTVKTGSLIDYESSGGSYTIWATASYGPFSSNAVAFTITVTNLAPATPTDSNATANEIDENPTNGTLVGITAASSDPHGGTVTFFLSDDAAGRFQIDSSTGVVSVADGSLLDYETATSHVIKIKATDGNLESAEASFTIGISDVNDPPVNSLPDAQTTDEDTTLLFDSEVFVYGTQPSVIYAEGVDAGDGKGEGMVAALLQDAAANPVAADQVRVVVVRFDLDVNSNLSLYDAVDTAANYLPGYEGNTPVLSQGTYESTTYAPQAMYLILSGLGTDAGITRVVFGLTSTYYAGYAVNKTST